MDKEKEEKNRTQTFFYLFFTLIFVETLTGDRWCTNTMTNYNIYEKKNQDFFPFVSFHCQRNDNLFWISVSLLIENTLTN